MHIEFIKAFLTELLDTSRHLLEKIPVDHSIYGKFNSAGVHCNEPEPVPNFYIAEREIHFYDSDWFINEQEQILIDKIIRSLDVSCGSELPNPRSLVDIVQIGINDWRLTMCALAEVLEQLYNQTQVDVLVLVDDYNWCFRPSGFKSFRYSSIRRLNGSIPPEHMSLIRLFMRFDGHRIRRGVKVFGNSNRTIRKHYFSPEKINFNDSHCFPLRGMTSIREVYNFQMLAIHSGAYKDNQRGLAYSKHLLMESQGNFSEMVKLMGFPALKSFDTTFFGKTKKSEKLKRKQVQNLKKIYNKIE